LQRGQRTGVSMVYSASYWTPSGSASLSWAGAATGGTLGAGFIATGMWVPGTGGVKRQSFDDLLLEESLPLFEAPSDFPLFSDESLLSDPLSDESAFSLPGFFPA
jgi:hypothetical protein